MQAAIFVMRPRPNLRGDAGWWQTRLWTYAVFALLIYARAAAERQGTTVALIAGEIAARHQLNVGEDAVR
jgi:hypothetical protein